MVKGQNMTILIYALPLDESRQYMEQLISSHCATDSDIARVKEAAGKDGWHSFRVVAHHDNTFPDFIGAIRR